MKALSTLAEEKTLAALTGNCFQPLWSLCLLWANLFTCTDRSLRVLPQCGWRLGLYCKLG